MATAKSVERTNARMTRGQSMSTLKRVRPAALADDSVRGRLSPAKAKRLESVKQGPPVAGIDGSGLNADN